MSGAGFCGDIVISTTTGGVEAGTAEETEAVALFEETEAVALFEETEAVVLFEETEAVALFGVTCTTEYVSRQGKSTTPEIRLLGGVVGYKAKCRLTPSILQGQNRSTHGNLHVSQSPLRPARVLQ